MLLCTALSIIYYLYTLVSYFKGQVLIDDKYSDKVVLISADNNVIVCYKLFMTC